VKIDWKVAGISASVFFVLSFLIGLISGNPFVAVLLRAILFAALGALGALGVRFVIERFLPEMLTGAGATEDRAPLNGQNVNIVVSDDGTDANEATLVEVVDAATDQEVSPNVEGKAAVSVAAGDFAEEIEELKADPLVTAEPGQESSPYEPIRPSEDLTDVDVLPDLDGFTSSFAPQASAGDASDRASSPSSSSAGRTKSGKSGDDPSLTAQAIRTVLAREQKG
jgi:hypothetical protein